MNGKQWLLITFVVILNVIIFGALLGDVSPTPRGMPTPTWTLYPTFTSTPFATATAILMPTLPGPPPTPALSPTPTPVVHIVIEGETAESIAERYGISAFVLKMVNRIPQSDEVQAGQELIIPVIE